MALPLRAALLRSLGFASIGATYTRVGTNTANQLRIVWIQNLTDKLLVFSFDAVNDHFVLSAGAYILMDVTSNQFQLQSGLVLESGTGLYVRQDTAAPTSGSVYFSSFYGKGE